MTPLDAKVRWNPDLLNPPTLQILVDHLPLMEKMVFTQLGQLYYGENEGLVDFFFHNPQDQRGYGGRLFHLMLDTGTVITLKGPWSSRSGVMNKAGFGPCMEASLVSERDSFDRGHTFTSCAITVELTREIIDEFLPGVYLVKEVNDKGEITFTVSKDPEEVKKE